MNTLKNITVLVAVLNKKDTIKNCIDSLLALNPAPKRIVVVDGYSQDSTYQILEKYRDRIDLFQHPKGLSQTFNWIFQKIDTEFTALTDADCVVSENWLEQLIKGFKEKDVIATAGYCGTPQGLSFFQTIIGLELEARFKKFPKYIRRAPTMNLCLKTEAARKIKFDERQMVDVEVDFGYRLTKSGRMIYLPQAKVFHYHRADLKSYFNQQKDYAKWGLRLVFKHGHKALADHITRPDMSLQIPISFLGFFFLLLSFFDKSFLFFSIIFFLVLLLIYFKNIKEINPPFSFYPAFLGLFVLRNIAWMSGIIEGLLFYAGKKMSSLRF